MELETEEEDDDEEGLWTEAESQEESGVVKEEEGEEKKGDGASPAFSVGKTGEASPRRASASCVSFAPSAVALVALKGRIS